MRMIAGAIVVLAGAVLIAAGQLGIGESAAAVGFNGLLVVIVGFVVLLGSDVRKWWQVLKSQEQKRGAIGMALTAVFKAVVAGSPEDQPP